MPPELIVLLTAATPVLELRGAIPVGLAMGLPPFEVWVLAIIGNILPVPFILLGMNWLFKMLVHIPRVEAWVNRIAEKGSGKLEANIQRWGWLGLIIFVGIPLPGTGAWTGSLAAVVLRLPFWTSLLSVAAGVLLASLLVSGLGLGIMSLL
ncbi:MAG: small multi-drug export protein [Syntrophomonadaceae bacterium]|nr:small multi-drug export protein [Syntrophomonadaceae bacterium]